MLTGHPIVDEVNEQEIIRLYKNEGFTLRRIAGCFNTDHHRIKRILIRNGLEVTQKGRVRKPFSEEHKKRISESCKGRSVWSEGKKMCRSHIIKNMVGHIKYDIDYKFVNQFNDIDKVKYLNHLLTRDRVSSHFNTEKYKQYMIKFYHDKQFNEIYGKWLKDKNKWAAPSLDHKTPLSRGGNYDIENLQILTWFENRTKAEMTQQEWDNFKTTTKTHSEMFV